MLSTIQLNLAFVTPLLASLAGAIATPLINKLIGDTGENREWWTNQVIAAARDRSRRGKLETLMLSMNPGLSTTLTSDWAQLEKGLASLEELDMTQPGHQIHQTIIPNPNLNPIQQRQEHYSISTMLPPSTMSLMNRKLPSSYQHPGLRFSRQATSSAPGGASEVIGDYLGGVPTPQSQSMIMPNQSQGEGALQIQSYQQSVGPDHGVSQSMERVATPSYLPYSPEYIGQQSPSNQYYQMQSLQPGSSQMTSVQAGIPTNQIAPPAAIEQSYNIKNAQDRVRLNDLTNPQGSRINTTQIDSSNNVIPPIYRVDIDENDLGSEMLWNPTQPINKRKATNEISQVNTPGTMEAAQSLNSGRGVANIIQNTIQKTLNPVQSDMTVEENVYAGDIELMRAPQTIMNQGDAPVVPPIVNNSTVSGNRKHKHFKKQQAVRSMGKGREKTMKNIDLNRDLVVPESMEMGVMHSGNTTTPGAPQVVSIGSGQKVRSLEVPDAVRLIHKNNYDTEKAGIQAVGGNPNLKMISQPGVELRDDRYNNATNIYLSKEAQAAASEGNWFVKAAVGLLNDFKTLKPADQRVSRKREQVSTEQKIKDRSRSRAHSLPKMWPRIPMISGVIGDVKIQVEGDEEMPTDYIYQQPEIRNPRGSNTRRIAGSLLGDMIGNMVSQAGYKLGGIASQRVAKLIGDAGEIVDVPHSGFKKLIGDAVGDPVQDEIDEGVVAMDTEKAKSQNALVANAKLNSYFGNVLSLMILEEQNLTSSYAGECRSFDDLLTNIIQESTSVQWAFNTTQLTTIAAIPGCSMWPLELLYYTSTNSADPWSLWYMLPLLWNIDQNAGEECVPLIPTFSIDNLNAAVKTGGAMTAFTNVLRLNASFFDADLLSRYFSIVLPNLTNRVGYGFEVPLLRLVLTAMSWLPVPGDEIAQFVNFMGTTYIKDGTNDHIRCVGLFPNDQTFTADYFINLRICDYRAFTRNLVGQSNDESINVEFEQGWSSSYWWPNSRDPINSVAVIFIRQQELDDYELIMGKIISMMACPMFQTFIKTNYYYWNMTTSTWNLIPAGAYHEYRTPARFTASTPIANFVSVRGPIKKVLLVISDAVGNPGTKAELPGTAHNVSFNRNNVYTNYPYRNTGEVQIDKQYSLGALKTAINIDITLIYKFLTKAIRAWEEDFGHASARNSAIRLAKIFSAVWGGPKVVARNFGVLGTELMGSKTLPPANVAGIPATSIWNKTIVEDNGWRTVMKCYSIVENCSGDPNFANFSLWPTSLAVNNGDPWERFKYTNAIGTYAATTYNPAIDFLVMRGFVIISEEHQITQISSSIFSTALSIREQGIMWAGLCDFIRQANNLTYKQKFRVWARWTGDPGLQLEPQLEQFLTSHVNSSLIEYFVTGIQFNVPMWRVNQRCANEVVVAIEELYGNAAISARIYVPPARVNQYTISRYNPKIQYADSIISFRGGALDEGALGHFLRNVAISAFYDTVIPYQVGNNAYNLMIRKLSMSYYVDGPEANDQLLIWTYRNAFVTQMPFVVDNPTSGLAFSLAYANWNGNILIANNASFRAYPIGYQLRSKAVEEATELALCFPVRVMRDAIFAAKTNYNILIVPTSVVAFIQNDLPPAATIKDLFQAVPGILDRF